MADPTCRHCGKRASPGVRYCPHCGVPDPITGATRATDLPQPQAPDVDLRSAKTKALDTAAAIGASLVVLALCVLAFAWCFGGDASEPRPAHNSVSALAACQQFVRARLRAPSTAKFPAVRSSDVATHQGGGRYVVSSYVDASNAFGAQIRNSYRCETVYEPASDSWRAINVTITP